MQWNLCKQKNRIFNKPEGTTVFLPLLLWISIATPIFSPLFAQAAHASSTDPTPTDEKYFIEKALAWNPEYKAYLHSASQKRFMRDSETGLMENPMFSFSLSNVPLSSFPSLSADPMSGAGFMLSQTFALPGEADSRRDMAKAEHQAESFMAAEARGMLVYRVRSVYQDLFFLSRKKSLLEENLSSLNQIVAIARSMVAVNRLSSASLLKLEAKLSQTSNEILETTAQISRSGASLESLCGVTWKAGGEGKLLPDAPESIVIPDKFSPEEHPVYKNSQSMLQFAEANKKHEEAKYFPSVTVGAEYMLREPVAGNSMSGEDMVSLSVTVPLPLYFAVKETRSVSAAQEGVKKASEKLAAARLSLESAWRGERDMAANLLEAYARFHAEVLPRYMAAYRAQLGSFSSSTASLLDVLDAYRDYLEASVREAEIYRDLKKSLAMLEYLRSGGSLEGGKGQN